MPKFITLKNVADFVGKTVDCHKRVGHHYPLKITRGANKERFYIVDRNAVSMPIGQSDNIAYDFIVEDKENGKK